MASSPITSWQIEGGKVETVRDFIFLGSKITAMMTAAMKLKDACSLEENYDQPRQHIEKQRHYLAYRGPYSQSYIFSTCLFNLYKEYIMRNARLDEAQTGIKIAGRNIDLR